MSLRDTIDGARREAKENVEELNAKPADEKGNERTGFSRKSAAASRPARDAATSVRVAGVAKSNPLEKPKDREERRAERRAARERDDLRSQGFNVVLKSTPGYKESERVWWVLLAIGFVLAIVSLVIAYRVEGANDFSTPAGIASIVSLVGAYIFIIGGFVYDLVKRRPMRKAAESHARGLSDKKLLELVAAGRAARAASRSK